MKLHHSIQISGSRMFFKKLFSNFNCLSHNLRRFITSSYHASMFRSNRQLSPTYLQTSNSIVAMDCLWYVVGSNLYDSSQCSYGNSSGKKIGIYLGGWCNTDLFCRHSHHWDFFFLSTQTIIKIKLSRTATDR